MSSGKIRITRPLISLLTGRHTARRLTTNLTQPPLPGPIRPTASKPLAPVNRDHLLRNSPESKLQKNLQKAEFSLDQEFFLQICNKFPMSWRSVYRFYQFTLAQPGFIHTSVTYNKMLDVIAKPRNIDLFWELLHEMARQKVANDKTLKLALRALAGARELKKCVEYFHLMKSYGYSYSLDTLNNVVETLCKERLVDEARHPNGVTYKHLICGFCDVGDLIEASRVWNLMIDNGFEADMDAVNTMIERFFKDNQFDEGLKLFQTMRVKRMDELGLST
ncbi:hypothetical protein Cgig2_027618 [Carnegiea gigantea]|uniref:Pentatricopeptide repeat-containing protein n=1 Tax=Carnegiea gigantea TaxID=171969 RepID=A0A9Q1K6A5_9CARY|nr:hypothetical protein Cgig2_027618 [Carnegiea gigantea]